MALANLTGIQESTGIVNTQKSHGNATRLSNAATLKIGTWNCGGLNLLKKDLIKRLEMDILCLTETHKGEDEDPYMINSDTPGKNDSWSGVALMVGQKLQKYIISTGSIGSRITFCRIRGMHCNLIIIGVYIPQKQRTNPDQNDVYTQLESLLLRTNQRDYYTDGRFQQSTIKEH